MGASSARTGNIKNNKTAKWILCGVVFAALLGLLVFRIIPGALQDRAEARLNAAATALLPESGLLDWEEKETRLFSRVREPWIAVRRNMEEGSPWRVIACSLKDAVTEADLKKMRTLIVCEGYEGNSANYARYVNGVQQGGSFTVTGEAVRIRCVDLPTGCVYGREETMQAKSLPNRNPSESSRTYSDSEVARTVRQIAASPLCPGYEAGAWSYDAGTETLKIADRDAIRGLHFCPVSETAVSIRGIENLPGSVKALYIPASVTSIADGVLDELWFVIADAGSYAWQYAREHGIPRMENGTDRILVPEERWEMNFGEASNTLEETWKQTGAKTLGIPFSTEIDNGLFWIGYTGVQVLVERDSPAEEYLLQNLGGYRTACSYTYREAWENESTGFLPDRGETVTLGRFEQDGDPDNGPEPVEWIVLDNDGETALLISRCALTLLNESKEGRRLPLFRDFAAAAFTQEELDVLEGETPEEKVFLPGKREVEGFLPTAQARSAILTEAVKAEGGYNEWVLAGGERGFGDVCRQGEIIGWSYQADCTVRPAVRIRLDAFRALEPQTVPYEPDP